MAADYVIGCDGANSKVRRSLFGDWNFPGFTWGEQIVATNLCPLNSLTQVYYPFEKHGVLSGQFIVDPSSLAHDRKNIKRRNAPRFLW